MKHILFNKNDYFAALRSDTPFIVEKTAAVKKTVLTAFSIRIDGTLWETLWPNREGELFKTPDVYMAIKKYSPPEGLKITYPSTASCRTFIFYNSSGSGFVFAAPPDAEGRVTEITINTEDSGSFILSVNGPETTWYSYIFNSPEELDRKLSSLHKTEEWNLLYPKRTDSQWQVQVGLVDPEGRTKVPGDRGFLVLEDIAEEMKNHIGENNILHIFGYGQGHDKGYPDYTPSELLGGKTVLRDAVDGVHKQGQKAVFYLNGRIAQTDNTRDLQNAVLRDKSGAPFIENYHGRSFFVMDPDSPEWIERLVTEAEKLRKTGADGVQLDQLGGRAALTPPGSVWGKGYIELIKNIQETGLTVWIQGLSDIYPADWFELTERMSSILDDGTIRGGAPIGKHDKRLFSLSVPNQVLLVPISKHDSSKREGNIIIDLNKDQGGLFMYNSGYMGTLRNMMSRSVNMFKDGAVNRVAAGIINN